MGLSGRRGRSREALAHLSRVNDWDLEAADGYIQDCFKTWEERSRYQWELDLSWLQENLP
jgi:hypothetical protein